MERGMSERAEMRRPQVVIIGAGFGGLSAAKALARAPVDVTLIDRQNHHLFQPLLYQVATAALSPADIAAPVRAILADQPNARVLLDEVEAIDTARREVVGRSGRQRYDYLVVATGARHAYFGRDDWAEHAPGLKTIDDATALRAKILLAFERAETRTDADERRGLLTFVVVGGGPTGVEMAGAVAELARRALARDFRTIDPRCTRVLLVEAGPRILPGFHPSLSLKAAAHLRQLGVEVRTGAAVTACDAAGVTVAGERIAARTVVWAAGVMASAAGRWLGVPVDRSGRVVVGPDLHPDGHAEIFVIGDTAATTDAAGRLLPGLAPVAVQEGRHVGETIRRRLAGRAPAPFRYRSYGQLATIGRKAAVAQFGRVHLAGWPAWLLWSIAHVCFLVGFRNRIAVAASWIWSYMTFERGSRLITGTTTGPAVRYTALTSPGAER
jgi:NADH dehydrogenase